MNLDPTMIAVVISGLANFAGLMKFALAQERRLTRIETRVEAIRENCRHHAAAAEMESAL